MEDRKLTDTSAEQSKIVGEVPKFSDTITQNDKYTNEPAAFGVLQFLKIVAFSFLTVFVAFFLGLRLRFLIETPFFFLSVKGETTTNLVWLAIAFLFFMVVLCITLVITSRSVVEFIPGWLLSGVALFIGIGNYGPAGILIGGGFLVSTIIFYMLVQSDIENSFVFSVRHAFSSLTIFFVMFFGVISAGYYFSTVDRLESVGKTLPDEVVTPIYRYERQLVAKQLGVKEDEIEFELARLREMGKKVKLGGVLGFLDISDVQEGADNLYSLTKEKLSGVIMPYVRWFSVGLSILLFLLLMPFSTLYSILLKPILWVIIEIFVAVGIIRRVKEMRECITLRI